MNKNKIMASLLLISLSLTTFDFSRTLNMTLGTFALIPIGTELWSQAGAFINFDLGNEFGIIPEVGLSLPITSNPAITFHFGLSMLFGPKA